MASIVELKRSDKRHLVLPPRPVFPPLFTSIKQASSTSTVPDLPLRQRNVSINLKHLGLISESLRSRYQAPFLFTVGWIQAEVCSLRGWGIRFLKQFGVRAETFCSVM